MRLLSNADYADKLTAPDIKGVLPSARNLALSRPASYIATSDVFCAIILQDEELMLKLESRYGISEEKLRKQLVDSLPKGYQADPVDEFEELQITPRVDNAFRNACIGRDSISSKELLRSLLQDECENDVAQFLIDLGVISSSYKRGGVIYIGFRPTGSLLKQALADFTRYMLDEDLPQYPASLDSFDD